MNCIQNTQPENCTYSVASEQDEQSGLQQKIHVIFSDKKHSVSCDSLVLFATAIQAVLLPQGKVCGGAADDLLVVVIWERTEQECPFGDSDTDCVEGQH